ncbi:hypothetical protein EC988_000232 [Linderina pennispora]|nr:hypothetical protein EC988_000232 [Linderina pennispora]
MTASHGNPHPVFFHNDIMGAVIDYIAQVHRHDLYYCWLPKDFRPLVNAAAVCQSWRRLALPLVFKSVIVEVERVAVEHGSGQVSRPVHREKCLSNVEFLPPGCENLAKDLVLSFGADVISGNAARYLEEIGVSGRSWPEVKLLSIHISAAELEEVDDLDDFDEHGDPRPLYSAKHVMQLTSYALKLVPNVTNALIQLDSRPSGGIDLEEGFGQRLQDIKMLTVCESVIYHNRALVVPQLTYLDINCMQLESVRWLAGASAATLKVLLLTGITRDLFYSSFFDAPESTSMVFSDLRVLVVYMACQMDDPHTPPSLPVSVPMFSFPRLKTLLLSTRACRSDTSWEMVPWFADSPLREVYLMGATRFAQQFDFSRYPDLRTFDALLADLTDQDSVELSSRLMSSKSGIRELALRTSRGGIPISLDMGSTNIYNLYLTTELTAAKLRSIVAQLPRLIFLGCNPPSEKSDGSDAVLGAEAVAMQIPAHDFSPIHSRLQEIKLHDLNWQGSMRYGMSRQFVDLAATFACIPSLLKVRIGVDFIDGGVFIRRLLTEMLATDATPHMRELSVIFGKIIETLFDH